MKRWSALFALWIVQALAAPASATDRSPVEWVTLGTSGGPQVQVERAQIANALVVGDDAYLLDTGNDVQRQLARAGIPERRIRAVFISHHHLDHNADLGPVMLTHWTFGRGVLKVFGPAGTRTLVAGLIAASPPTTLAGYPVNGKGPPPLKTMVAATDIAAAQDIVLIYADQRIRVSAILADHYQSKPSIALLRMPQAVAYRIEVAGKTIVYTGDTGPSANVTRLAQGADLLVSEIVDPDAIAGRIAAQVPNIPAGARAGIMNGMRINHLVADEVGKLAAAAGVKQFVLTHFVPLPEQLAPDQDCVAPIRRRFAGPVKLANDLDRFVP